MQPPSDGGSNNPPHAPMNDASGPSPQSQWPRWVHVVFFTFVVHLVMDLWYTCGLWWTCNLFGWTWALIIIYCDGCDMGGRMCGWMRYICDGWDIYVIYVCMNVFVMMECKKKLPFWVTLPSVALGKGPVAECHGHNTRQSWVLWPWHSAKNFF